jgi:hypothetical protein
MSSKELTMRIELVERDENLHIGPTRSGEWIDVSKLADGNVSFAELCSAIESGVAFDAPRWLVRPGGKTVALWHNSFVWTTDASPNARVLLGRDHVSLKQDAFDRILVRSEQMAPVVHFETSTDDTFDATLQVTFAGWVKQDAFDDSSYRVMTDERREKIARDYELWLEYVDPDGVLSQDDWQAMTVNERVAMMNEVFPNG